MCSYVVVAVCDPLPALVLITIVAILCLMLVTRLWMLIGDGQE